MSYYSPAFQEFLKFFSNPFLFSLLVLSLPADYVIDNNGECDSE